MTDDRYRMDSLRTHYMYVDLVLDPIEANQTCLVEGEKREVVKTFLQQLDETGITDRQTAEEMMQPELYR